MPDNPQPTQQPDQSTPQGSPLPKPDTAATNPQSNLNQVQLFAHFLGFGVSLTVARYLLNSLLYVLLTVLVTFSMTLFPGTPTEMMPVDILPYLSLAAIFIVSVFITQQIRKKGTVNYILVLIFSLISLLIVSAIEYILCSISFFCTVPNFRDTLLSAGCQIGVIVLGCFFSKLYRKSVIWLVLIYCIAFPIITFGLLFTQTTNAKSNSFVYNNQFKPSQFESYSIPQTSLSWPIPKIAPQSGQASVTTPESETKYIRDDFIKDYPQFQALYEVRFMETIGKGITTSYNYSVLIPKVSSTTIPDREFLNNCNAVTKNESKIQCDDANPLITLDNGITYCKAYNPHDRSLDRGDGNPASPQTLLTKLAWISTRGFSFEDADRYYIAKPTQGNEFCFIFNIYNHETNYTKTKTVDALAGYIFSALQYKYPLTTPTATPMVIPTPEPIADWKSYTIDLNNLTFKYPSYYRHVTPITVNQTPLKADEEYWVGTNGSNEILLGISLYKSTENPEDWWISEGKNKYEKLEAQNKNPGGIGTSYNFGFSVKNITFADKAALSVTISSDYESPAFPIEKNLIIIQNNGYITVAGYHDNSESSVELSKQILSTFRFSD